MSMFNRSFLSCELIGNLGQEPKSVQTKTGKPMATFTVAVTTSVKDADGNWSNQTQWVGCTTFGGFAERALKVLHKGTMVLVKGEPAVRQFTKKDGTTCSKSSSTTLLFSLRPNAKQAMNPSRPVRSVRRRLRRAKRMLATPSRPKPRLTTRSVKEVCPAFRCRTHF